MLSMILKMSAVTAGNIIFSFVLWKFLKNKKMNWGYRYSIALTKALRLLLRENSSCQR